jgi:hypothetical protein
MVFGGDKPEMGEVKTARSGDGVTEEGLGGGGLPVDAESKEGRKGSVVLEDEIFDERYEGTKRGRLGGSG